MAQLRVNIHDVTRAKTVPVELPDDIPVRKLLPALVSKMGLPTTQDDKPIEYALVHRPRGKSSKLLDDRDTMISAGVEKDDELAIVDAMIFRDPVLLGIKLNGIPGVNPQTVKDVPLQELSNQPAALVMVARQYEQLAKEFNKQSIDLEIEKQKSTDRLTATLLLLVSQVVLSLGTNLLTSNQIVPAAVVLVAGGLQALLAIYLSFRRPKRRETEKDS